jgi:hypothetical protein
MLVPYGVLPEKESEWRAVLEETLLPRKKKKLAKIARIGHMVDSNGIKDLLRDEVAAAL